MDLHLQGKIALVTGASRGLGFAIAKLLAAEGAKVAINSRSIETLSRAQAEILHSTGTDVFLVPGDISQPEIPSALIEKTIQHFGGLDILVTNAGGPPPGKFETFDDSDWSKALELTLMSPIRLIRVALPYLKNSPSASVLTVTSISVKQPIANLGLSNTIRLAVIGLTKHLALELGNQGIRFNSIIPSWTETERVQDLMADRARSNNTTIAEEYAKLAKESPLGRLATPEEFAQSAVFLLSPAASYLTGTMLSVDGGMYKGIF